MKPSICELLSRPVEEQEEFLRAHMKQTHIRRIRDSIARQREELNAEEIENKQSCSHPSTTASKDCYRRPMYLCNDCGAVIYRA